MEGLTLRMFEDNALEEYFQRELVIRSWRKWGLHNLHPSLNVDMNSESIRARMM
jgi:hypothetical protein